MDQALIFNVTAERPWRQTPRRRGRLGRVLWVSLWLHLTLLLLLVMTVRYDRLEEGLPPPSTVEMVFGEGKSEGPVPPEPQPYETRPPEPAAPPTPAPRPPAIALSPPMPQIPAPTPPPLPALPQPQAIPQPQTEAGELPAGAPPPVTAAPPRPAPAPKLALVVPKPPPPAPPPMAPAQPRATPSFPAPTNFSLGQRKPEKHSTTRQTSRGRSTLDISLTMRDGDTGTVMNGRGGADWGNELVAWVNRHKYYPPQAAMQGEDGEVTARVVVNPNGHVTSVDLTMRSGSQWLDMALVALFRDRDVPPPPDKNEPTIVNFTMRYILIRQ